MTKIQTQPAEITTQIAHLVRDGHATTLSTIIADYLSSTPDPESKILDGLHTGTAALLESADRNSVAFTSLSDTVNKLQPLSPQFLQTVLSGFNTYLVASLPKDPNIFIDMLPRIESNPRLLQEMEKALEQHNNDPERAAYLVHARLTVYGCERSLVGAFNTSANPAGPETFFYDGQAWPGDSLTEKLEDQGKEPNAAYLTRTLAYMGNLMASDLWRSVVSQVSDHAAYPQNNGILMPFLPSLVRRLVERPHIGVPYISGLLAATAEQNPYLHQHGIVEPLKELGLYGPGKLINPSLALKI